MNRISAGLRILEALVFLLACPGCELLVGDGDYKVDPAAFADGGLSGKSGASGTSGGASGTHSSEGGSGAGSTGTSAGAAGAAMTGSVMTGATGTTGAGTTGAATTGASTTGTTGTSGMIGTSGTSVPADASVDQSAPDGGSDGGGSSGFDAGHDAGVDAGYDAGTPNVCAAQSGDDTCTACQKTSCCAALSACGPDCGNVFSCVNACTSTTSSAPCGCFETYPNGIAQFDALDSCTNTNCAFECNILGDNGDPCSVNGECEQGTCGSAAPHAPSNACAVDGCAFDSDCLNLINTSGNNIFGETVSCITDGNVNTCFPGCQSSTDCAPFPGTTCQAAVSVDGAGVTICAFPP